MQPLDEAMPTVEAIAERCRQNAALPDPQVESSAEMIARVDVGAMRRRAREASIIGARFASAAVETYRAQPGTRASRDAAAAVIAGGFTDSLALFGPDTGIGKTYLLAGLANAAIDAGKRAIVANALEIVTRVADARRTWDVSEHEAISQFADAEFFGLDDLGKDLFAGESALRTIYQIVDRRFNSGRPLWLSSNFSFAELGKRYSERKDEYAEYLMDRIRAMIPLDRWVEMRGRSLRGRI